MSKLDVICYWILHKIHHTIIVESWRLDKHVGSQARKPLCFFAHFSCCNILVILVHS